MLPPTRNGSSSGPRSHSQYYTLNQDEHSMGSAQDEAGPSGSRRVARGNMYAMSRGTFAGSSVRHSLELLQEPVSGRRRTDKDRRPLTHCPILRLRVYTCHQLHTGEWSDEEADVSSFECSNYVCAADLQPHISSMSASGPIVPTIAPRPRQPQASSILSDDADMPPPLASSSRDPIPTAARSAPGPTLGHTALSSHSGSSRSLSTPLRGHGHDLPHLSIPQTTLVQRTYDELSPTNDRRAAPPGEPQTKRRKALGESERNLYGALHLPASKLPAPNGEFGMWFLFTDLTVQLEGTYVLRFRVYDLSTIEGYSHQTVQPLVEILSSPFTVFSPRTFPGVPKPTPLSEHFTSLGFKLNTKKNEKQSRAGPSRSTTRKTAPERPAPQPLQSDSPATQSRHGMMSSSIEHSDTSTPSVFQPSGVCSFKDQSSSSSSVPTSTTNSANTVQSISSMSNLSNIQPGAGGGSSTRLGALGKVEEMGPPALSMDGDLEMDEPQR